ncbi:alkaline phosphatase family protein [Sphingomonas sp.]|uniref:alkaline phosphatase family protein n=1 Tax=Sphingomonas sp. TaxID=28214 RepID=UPI0018327CD8|nr:alkaline phosphatase family protein [Sphingomonas sp.]MBA3512029.1 alkaline phosphatase family protein [Sphingomonas sp.]
MRKLLVLLAAMLAVPASAIPPLPGPPPAPPPRLLIVLAIDGLSADLFDEYRPMLFGGLGRLARGTVFPNGYQSHAATETCPGHSTMLTGLRPARTGIIANYWTDQSLSRSDKSVYCAEDVRAPGSSSTAYTVSPVHLKGMTLGERLKRSSPASRNVAVGGKDRAAVMMGGQLVDQRWYWDGKRFASDLKAGPTPHSVTRANGAVAAMIAASQAPLDPPQLCSDKARLVPIEGGGKPVGAGRFGRGAGDANGFRASPAFDGAVLALAAGLIEEMQLGRDASPDLLSIGLSATDFVGHSYGIRGQEMCLQLLSLDRDLGDFFRLLDRSGLDYAVALTADHGFVDIPERLRQQNVPTAARAEPGLDATEVGKRIAAKLKLSGPVLIGDFFGDIYIDRALKPADRARVLREAVAAYSAHPQVQAVFTAEQLARAPMPSGSPDRWTMLERARASFDPDRSGDLVVLLRQHVTPVPNTTRYIATHGSPWDYDRRVPILFWRPAMPPANRNEAIETVDIMPTLAAMLGIQVDPASIDGKCLTGVQGVACPPR